MTGQQDTKQERIAARKAWRKRRGGTIAIIADFGADIFDEGWEAGRLYGLELRGCCVHRDGIGADRREAQRRREETP